MRKIFLDIGSHDGQTLALAIKRYPNMDLYIGIEPLEDLSSKTWDKIPDSYKDKIEIHNTAVDSIGSDYKIATFYQDIGGYKLGSSLYKDKIIRKKREIKVNVEDIRHFFARVLNDNDEIILKIDVEGKEYDILECMIDNGLLKNVITIHAEWHWHKTKSLTEKRHLALIGNLNKLGYQLTGNSKKDEFYTGP